MIALLLSRERRQEREATRTRMRAATTQRAQSRTL